MTSITSTPHPRVADFLGHLGLASRRSHKALTLWPLVRDSGAPEPSGPSYVALVDAMETGRVLVDEIHAGGSVPHVRVRNRGAQAVLILFGEELVGAKQNRVANASFLVPARSEVLIDVSCVEQGRWSQGRGTRFAAGTGVVSHGMRQKMASRVATSLARGGRFDADQREVWGEVEARLAGSGTSSRTAAYADYIRSRTVDLDEIRRAFSPVPGQVGFVAAIGDGVAGLEVVGRPEVFECVASRLVEAYAIDALDPRAAHRGAPRRWLRRGEEARRPARFESPEGFLDAVATAPASSVPSLGVGEDVRIEGGEVTGCALAWERLVHLTAFPVGA